MRMPDHHSFSNMRQYLQPLAPFLDAEPRFSYSGPRNWWGGPLDVEGLALGSVDCFAYALTGLLPKVQGNQLRIESSRVAASFSSLNNLRINGRPAVGFAELSGFFPAMDGWVRLHANYPHHRKALEAALGEREFEGIRRVLQETRAAEVERLVNSAGGVASAVRSAQAWLQRDATRTLSKEPWIDFSLTHCGNRRRCFSTSRSTHPLHGLRILDLTRVIAGPSATKLLGALGANVLRIDPPSLPELEDQHVDTGFD